MRVSACGSGLMRLNAARDDPCRHLGRGTRGRACGGAAAVWSHAAKGHETGPRRLVSEVGASETGQCVGGAREPGS